MKINFNKAAQKKPLLPSRVQSVDATSDPFGGRRNRSVKLSDGNDYNDDKPILAESKPFQRDMQRQIKIVTRNHE